MYGATIAFMFAALQSPIIAFGSSTAVIAGLELLAGIAVAYGFTLWETSLDYFTTTGAMPLGFALVAPAAALFGTRNTMLACGLLVIGLCAAALLADDVRRLRSP